jgi:hypothetical protein
LALSRSFTIKAAKLLARLYPNTTWPTDRAVGALPQLYHQSCQTIGKTLSGFALPTVMFFLYISDQLKSSDGVTHDLDFFGGWPGITGRWC